MTSTKPPYTVSEIAKFLGRSERWVRDACARAVIPAHRVDGRFLIPAAEFAVWWESCRVQPERPVESFRRRAF